MRGRVLLVRLQLFLQVLVEVELVLVDVSSFEVKVVDVPRDRPSSSLLLLRRGHLLPVAVEEQRLVEFALLQVDLADGAVDLVDLLLVDDWLTEVTVDPAVGEEQRLAQLSSLVEQLGQQPVEIDEGEILLQLVHQFVLQGLQGEVNGLLVVALLAVQIGQIAKGGRQRRVAELLPFQFGSKNFVPAKGGLVVVLHEPVDVSHLPLQFRQQRMRRKERLQAIVDRLLVELQRLGEVLLLEGEIGQILERLSEVLVVVGQRLQLDLVGLVDQFPRLVELLVGGEHGSHGRVGVAEVGVSVAEDAALQSDRLVETLRRLVQPAHGDEDLTLLDEELHSRGEVVRGEVLQSLVQMVQGQQMVVHGRVDPTDAPVGDVPSVARAVQRLLVALEGEGEVLQVGADRSPLVVTFGHQRMVSRSFVRGEDEEGGLDLLDGHGEVALEVEDASQPEMTLGHVERVAVQGHPRRAVAGDAPLPLRIVASRRRTVR